MMPDIYGPIDYDKIGEAGDISRKVATVFIINGLDQDVTIQLKGNIYPRPDNVVDVGSSFTISANSPDARTLTPDTSGWLPYLYASLSCSTAPTTGSITAYLVRDREDMQIMVDSLEIRDTATHDPSSDPDKVRIVEW